MNDTRAALAEKAFQLLSGGYDYAVATATAEARAEAGDWTSDGPASATRDFLAYVLSSEVLASNVNDAHPDASKLLSRTWVVIAKEDGYQEGQSVPKGDNPTQANALAIVAIVVGSIALAAIVIYVVYRASQIVSERLALNAADRELVRSHEEARKVIEAHQAKEALAGHPIPYDVGELAILRGLADAQDAAAKVQLGTVGNAGKPPADAIDGVLVGLLVAGAAGIYLATRR